MVALLSPDGAGALPELRDAAEQAVAAGAETIVLDLAAVPRPTGDQVGELASVAFVCEKAKKGLALAAASADTLRSIELLGFAALFPYRYADRADALARLAKTTIAPPGEPPLEIGF